MVVTEKDVKLIDAPENVSSREDVVTEWFHEALRQVMLFPALRLFVPLKVEGIDNLQGAGPYIFAANHASHLDAPVVLASLPLHLRLRLRVAAAADYFFTNWRKGMLVRSLINAFPFERKGPACGNSLAYTAQLLKEGKSVLLFPEGTRSKDGQMQLFRTGVGRLALAGTAPVVPIWIEGTHQALPKGATLPRRRTVTLRFGKPLHFTPGDDVFEVVAEIERQVRRLSRTAKNV